MDSLFFLNRGNFGRFNRRLAEAIGLVEAILLTELIEKVTLLKDNLINDPKYGDGWLPYSEKEYRTKYNLTDYNHRKVLKKLISIQAIEMKSFGTPCKLHIRFKEDLAKKLFFDIGLASESTYEKYKF